MAVLAWGQRFVIRRYYCSTDQSSLICVTQGNAVDCTAWVEFFTLATTLGGKQDPDKRISLDH